MNAMPPCTSEKLPPIVHGNNITLLEFIISSVERNKRSIRMAALGSSYSRRITIDIIRRQSEQA
jgi:hypothetical protein